MGGAGHNQMAEHLPSMCEDLGFMPDIAKKRRGRARRRNGFSNILEGIKVAPKEPCSIKLSQPILSCFKCCAGAHTQCISGLGVAL